MELLLLTGDPDSEGVLGSLSLLSHHVRFVAAEVPSLPEARKQRSVVIVRLISRGDALTDVTLHHVGWGEGGEWDKAHDYFAKSWPNVLKNLQKRFDSGPVDWKPWLDMLRSKAPPAKK